jgi:hypothetical protein
MIHTVPESTSSSSSSEEQIRAMEQELFGLLSRVVAAESHEVKAVHVRRLVDGTRRLAEALGLTSSPSSRESTSASSDDGSFVDVVGPPVATLAVGGGVVNESSTIRSEPVRSEEAPEARRPIKEEDEEDTDAHSSVIGNKKPRIVASVEIHAGAEDKGAGDFSVVVKDYRASQACSKRIEVVDAGPGSWRITVPSDSTASDGVETIEDSAIRQKLRSVAEEPTDHGLVLYKGKMVPVNIQPVLSHIVDDWNDHFSSTCQPKNVTMNVDKFIRTNDCNAYRWQSNVSFTYAIRDLTFKSDMFAMDGIYFDLVRNASDGYGSEWINIYIPDSTWLGFQSRFRNETLWAPRIVGMTKDANQRLHCITAQIGGDDPAKIYEVMFCREAVAETSATCADGVSVQYRGNFPDVYSSDNGNAVYKGTGFFSLSVTTVDQHSNAPRADGSKKVSLEFNLAAARFFGVSNGESVARFGNGTTRMYV